jgi:hypothetical protein
MRSADTWGSALTSDEFAAIRGVGFEAVGDPQRRQAAGIRI